MPSAGEECGAAPGPVPTPHPRTGGSCAQEMQCRWKRATSSLAEMRAVSGAGGCLCLGKEGMCLGGSTSRRGGASWHQAGVGEALL